VIYELCCGLPPFVGEGSGDVLAAHIHLPVPPMTARGAEVPPAVEELVLHLLAKAPADRVQSAEELIRAIDAVTADRATITTGPRRAPSMMTSPTVTTLSGSATTSMMLPRAGRRRWPIAAVSVGLAAIAVVVVALAMRRGGDAPAIASHPADPPTATAVPAQPAPASPPPAGTPAAPPAAVVPGAPGNEPAMAPPSPAPAPAEPAAPPASEERSAAPAPDEPATPDPGRSEPRAPSGSDAPRPAPRPRSQASPPREPRAHGGDTIEVAVDSAPPGAQVVIDGAVLGTTPYRSTRARRDRDVKLVVRLAGYADKVVVAHESLPIAQSVTLVRKAAPPAPRSPKTDRDRSVNPF